MTSFGKRRKVPEAFIKRIFLTQHFTTLLNSPLTPQRHLLQRGTPPQRSGSPSPLLTLFQIVFHAFGKSIMPCETQHGQNQAIAFQ